MIFYYIKRKEVTDVNHQAILHVLTMIVIIVKLRTKLVGRMKVKSICLMEVAIL